MKTKNNELTAKECNEIIIALQYAKRIAMAHYEDNHKFFDIVYHNAEAIQDDVNNYMFDNLKTKNI